jgi:hypothetical protein
LADGIGTVDRGDGQQTNARVSAESKVDESILLNVFDIFSTMPFLCVHGNVAIS